MTIRKILTEPDPFLRQLSYDVEKVDDEIRKLMDDMLETMYAAPGIGLAAIQIGVPKRVIVIDLSKEEEKKPLYFVNPKIITKSKDNSSYEEGCLSVPGQFAEVDRPNQCHFSYLDYDGEKKKFKSCRTSSNMHTTRNGPSWRNFIYWLSIKTKKKLYCKETFKTKKSIRKNSGLD